MSNKPNINKIGLQLTNIAKEYVSYITRNIDILAYNEFGSIWLKSDMLLSITMSNKRYNEFSKRFVEVLDDSNAPLSQANKAQMFNDIIDAVLNDCPTYNMASAQEVAFDIEMTNQLYSEIEEVENVGVDILMYYVMYK